MDKVAADEISWPFTSSSWLTDPISLQDDIFKHHVAFYVVQIWDVWHRELHKSEQLLYLVHREHQFSILFTWWETSWEINKTHQTFNMVYMLNNVLKVGLCVKFCFFENYLLNFCFQVEFIIYIVHPMALPTNNQHFVLYITWQSNSPNMFNLLYFNSQNRIL